MFFAVNILKLDLIILKQADVREKLLQLWFKVSV